MSDDGSPQRTPDFRTAVEDVKALATVFAMEAESILGRRTVRVLGVLVLFAVVVGILLALLDWYIAPTDANQKQALVVTIAQILGGAALLSGLYFTWRTLQVNREGQITERFTRAIDQLGATDDDGNPRLEIRLGGIYALERIARDSARDYGPVMEVLTAYIRENAPWPPKPPKAPEEGFMRPPGGSTRASASDDIDEQDEGAEQVEESTEGAPSTDIQAILDVLSRREEERVRSLDLRGTDLRGANLIGARLEGANLRSAHLERANLGGAHLEGAVLGFAHLEGALLGGAHLEGAHLGGAHLEGTNLYRAHLEGADLEGVESLTPEQIEWAIGDEETTELPEYLVDHRPARWSKSGEEQDQIIAHSGPNARLREETSEQG